MIKLSKRDFVDLIRGGDVNLVGLSFCSRGWFADFLVESTDVELDRRVEDIPVNPSRVIAILTESLPQQPEQAIAFEIKEGPCPEYKTREEAESIVRNSDHHLKPSPSEAPQKPVQKPEAKAKPAAEPKKEKVDAESPLMRFRFTKMQKEMFDKFCEVQPIRTGKKRSNDEILERTKVRQALYDNKFEYVQNLINKYQGYKDITPSADPEPNKLKVVQVEENRAPEIEERELPAEDPALSNGEQEPSIEEPTENQVGDEDIELEFSEFEETVEEK